MATAPAICKTGFCTCVDFTDCMMIGECVFPWRYIAIEEDLGGDENSVWIRVKIKEQLMSVSSSCIPA